MPSSRKLTQRLAQECAYAPELIERLARDEAPTWAGYPIGSDVLADAVYVYAIAQSIPALADAEGSADRMVRLLKRIDGRRTLTFYSYRVAESLLRYGAWSDNPLLADLDEATRAEIRTACDTTSIVDMDAGELPRHPNNYWAVVARAEVARERLGILDDDRILNVAVERTAEKLFGGPSPFLNDVDSEPARHDIYSFDALLFAEPFWDRMDQDRLRTSLEAHQRVFESLFDESGACVLWGRSIGALSVAMSLEWSTLALERGLGSRSKMLAACEIASSRLREWFDADGLITAHKRRSPFRYRGPHRWLQMSFDVVGKALLSVERIANSPLPTRRSNPFTKIDEWIPLGGRGYGVWRYRDERWAFQLPVVTGPGADYAPFPRCPGVLEVPVDTDLVCGVPRGVIEGGLTKGVGRLISAKHSPKRLELRYADFPTDDGHLPGEWRATWSVEGSDLVGRFEARSGQTQRFALSLPTARRNLMWSEGVRLDVSGMPQVRTFWGELRGWTDVSIDERAVTVKGRVQPRVRILPGDHDYVHGLIDGMPAVEFDALNQGVPATEEWIERLAAPGVEVLHVGWPEHLFQRNRGKFEFGAFEALLDRLERRGIRVAWTLHNRLPHGTDPDMGRRLYRLWAERTHMAHHHSEWGRQTILAELPFQPSCRHVVAPHGNYQAAFRGLPSLSALAEKYGLDSGVTRIGVLGRYQPEKRVEMVAAAFAESTRDDLRLLVTACHAGVSLPDDPRIERIDRDGWLDRRTMAEHGKLCHALVTCPEGSSYLTTGVPADAIGLGVPVIGHDWEFLTETLGDALLAFDTPSSLTELFEGLPPERLRRAARASKALRESTSWSFVGSWLASTYGQLGLGHGR